MDLKDEFKDNRPQQGYGQGLYQGYTPQPVLYPSQQGNYLPQQDHYQQKQGSYPPQQSQYNPQGELGHQQGYPNEPQGFNYQSSNYGSNSQQLGRYSYKEGYPPQYGGYDNRKPPESVHEHPLNYQENINDECKNCRRIIMNRPGYKCNNCPLVLDMECSDKIFYGEKKKNCHPHPLSLRDRYCWTCDICKRPFRGKCSFYCSQCDFDACGQCYLQY